MNNWISQRSWLQITMGTAMLAVTLIGLFIYQHRSYNTAIWDAKSDLMQSRIGLTQCDYIFNLELFLLLMMLL